MARLGPVVALVYAALWCWADDGGVARIEPADLKGEIFNRWTEVTQGAVTEALVRLHGAGRIRPYAIGDELYAEIPTLAEHSPINHPSKFRYPRNGQAVSDLMAWITGQYTTGALLEGSGTTPPPLAISHQPSAHPNDGTAADYTTRCTVALNRAVEAIAPSVLATRADREQRKGTAAAWERGGIPVNLAEAVIAERVRGADPHDPPRSLAYFDAAVRAAFERGRAGTRRSIADIAAQGLA